MIGKDNWTYNLKPGDKVLVDGNSNAFNGGAPDTTTGRVFKVTATLVILQDGKDEASAGYRFDRLSGVQKTSDSYNRKHLIEPTEAALTKHRADWRRYKLVTRLKQTKWSAFPDPALERFYKLLQEELTAIDLNRIIMDNTH